MGNIVGKLQLLNEAFLIDFLETAIDVFIKRPCGAALLNRDKASNLAILGLHLGRVASVPLNIASHVFELKHNKIKNWIEF